MSELRDGFTVVSRVAGHKITLDIERIERRATFGVTGRLDGELSLLIYVDAIDLWQKVPELLEGIADQIAVEPSEGDR